MTNGHLPPLPGGNIVDLGQLIQQKAQQDQMKQAKVVVFPLQFAIEWMQMDGSYTIVAQGLPRDARNIGAQPALTKDAAGRPCVVLLFTHPEWEEHSSTEIPILEVTWERRVVESMGGDYVPEVEA